MTGTFLYDIYGLTVATPMRLSSVHEAASEARAVDLRIDDGSPDYFAANAPSSPADPHDWLHHVVMPDGRVFMRVEGVFEAIVSSDGHHAICRRLGDVDFRSFEANLVNFVLAASLTLQGEEPLHATVVELEGRAVGLLGFSGAGKSSLAAFLIARGADLVTDDMLRLKFVDRATFAYPGPYRLKLLEEPGWRFLPEALQDGHFNPLSGKVMVRPRSERRSAGRPVPLAALFRLEVPPNGDAADGVSAVRLIGVECAKAIISSAMDNHYDELPRLGRQMRFASRLADALPIYSLIYPRNFDVIGEVAAYIERALQPGTAVSA